MTTSLSQPPPRPMFMDPSDPEVQRLETLRSIVRRCLGGGLPTPDRIDMTGDRGVTLGFTANAAAVDAWARVLDLTECDRTVVRRESKEPFVVYRAERRGAWDDAMRRFGPAWYGWSFVEAVTYLPAPSDEAAGS